MNSTHDETGTILGYVWPKLTRCPHCGCQEYVEGGRNGKTIQYRFCGNLRKPSCPGHTSAYKVIAIAIHIDTGGDQSEIRPI